MARIRTVKPGFFTSLSIAMLTDAAKLTFVGLWTYVDDEGRGVDDARIIKATVWPLDDLKTPRKVEGLLRELAGKGRIVRYEVAGRRYLEVVNWKEHQHVNRPQRSTLPANPEAVKEHGTDTDRSRSDHGARSEGSRQEGKGREGKGLASSSSVSDSPGSPVEPVESHDDDGISDQPPTIDAAGVSDLDRVCRAVARVDLQRLREDRPDKAPDQGFRTGQWLSGAADKARGTHGAEIAKLLADGWTVHQVIERLRPPRQPAKASEHPLDATAKAARALAEEHDRRAEEARVAAERAAADAARLDEVIESLPKDERAELVERAKRETPGLAGREPAAPAVRSTMRELVRERVG